MKVGFTGTRQSMTDLQLTRLRQLLLELSPKEVMHGMCVGSDEQFHKLVRTMYPDCKIIGFPGTNANRNESIFRANVKVDEIRDEKHYYARNRDIVDESDFLIAAPIDMHEVGGTWYTINYAKNITEYKII